MAFLEGLKLEQLDEAGDDKVEFLFLVVWPEGFFFDCFGFLYCSAGGDSDVSILLMTIFLKYFIFSLIICWQT